MVYIIELSYRQSLDIHRTVCTQMSGIAFGLTLFVYKSNQRALLALVWLVDLIDINVCLRCNLALYLVCARVLSFIGQFKTIGRKLI